MSHVLYIVSMIHMIRESSLSSMQPPCVAAARRSYIAKIHTNAAHLQPLRRSCGGTGILTHGADHTQMTSRTKMRDLPRNDVPKRPDRQERLDNPPGGRRDHVRDGRSDLDGEEAGDTDEEAHDALQMSVLPARRRNKGRRRGGQDRYGIGRTASGGMKVPIWMSKGIRSL